MSKFMSLLKAMMSQDMNLFRVKTKKTDSLAKSIAVPLGLAFLVMFSVGSMYFPVAIQLNEQGLIHILLALTIVMPSILIFFEGMYKSQSILFLAKDTELLFSLPISKKRILLARLIKLYCFQLLYSFLFVIPGFITYAFFAKPTIYFYIITAFYLVTMPLIPTVLACFVGFLIKRFSINFRAKKAVEVVITFAIIIAIMLVSFNSESVIQNFVDDAVRINEQLTSFYIPAESYQKLAKSFDVLEFSKYVLLNIIAVFLFVTVVSKSFFKISSKESDKIVLNIASKSKELSYKPKSTMKALIIKDCKRFFSSTVYIFNTMFGLVLLVIATFSLCTNFDQAMSTILEEDATFEALAMLRSILPGLYLSALIAMSFMTSITSSSISIEGKTFAISKALPVNIKTILTSKILMSDMLTIPVVLICDIIVFLSFKISIQDILMIILASFIAPTISAIFGLLTNLKYPKMDASSDAEVVKQSKSTLVAVLTGIFMAVVLGTIAVSLSILTKWGMIITAIILLIVLLILWHRLEKVGVKRFREIEV